MADILDAARLAVLLVLGLDPGLLRIVALSVGVSLSATLLAALLGLPLAVALAVWQFPGRQAMILLANALLGLPPVVVGLALYLLLSRSGPFGMFGLLFSPAAMILAQTLLALPIVTAIGHRAAEAVWRRYGNDFLALGLTRLQAAPHLLVIGRAEVLTTVLAAFGRTISEVGAILIVGGNITGHTRTMTTAITLETSQGHFAFALALGFVLIGVSIATSSAAFALSRAQARAAESSRP